MFNEGTQLAKAVFSWVGNITSHTNIQTFRLFFFTHRIEIMVNQGGTTNEYRLQLLPTVTSTGYEKSASSAKKLCLFSCS